MDAMNLSLLGGFHLEVGGAPVAVPPGGQRLMALLAVKGPTSRSVVAGTLWPEVNEARAAGNLRSVRWRLPRRDLVIGEGRELRLAPQCDLQETHPEQALLPDWDEPWLVLPRAELRERGLRSLERRGVALLADGRHLDAMTCARTVINADPLSEPAYRLLVAVHIAEGNPAAALRVEREYAALLERELELAPSSQMLALLRLLDRPRDVAVTVA